MASSSSSSTKGYVNVITLRCPNHPDAELVEDYHAGDVVCMECGIVVGDRIIDVGSEWRTFSNEKDSKDNSRVGAAENSLLEGSDLSTCITMGSGPASFNENGRPIYNNRRNISSGDRALMIAFREIAQMADRLNLPKMIADRANTIFKQVHVSKSLKGRSNDAISSACMYIACRQEGVPRTFKELCAVSKVSKKEIGRAFKLILKIINTSVELISTGDFMSRFCSNLGLSAAIQKAAIHIADKAVLLNLVAGRSPVSVAAAAIYMASQASDDKKTAKEIGDVSGVAEVTVKHAYKSMYPKAHDLFPEDFKFCVPVEQLPSM
ncbi:hypothetical protein HELRODRAFT_185984 [Helobdella robusta]|uniref:Transcription initiation factor IIB n=1 Tax=Helobdella robusta TaxID=6412 RepID=T1FNI7_HELRO|nr:hypothetical protein HELRODRAFT_185984 [Helobdella robusta]ESN95389.1 hypothetical protein HELRODRAFT_185984 [Helobdella robusta]